MKPNLHPRRAPNTAPLLNDGINTYTENQIKTGYSNTGEYLLFFLMFQ